MQEFRGYLLSTVRFGESDAVVHFFTLQGGFKSFFLKGIYAPKNKKKALLSPLNECAFIIKSPKAGLENITALEHLSKSDFHGDYKAQAVLFFVADFLNQILRQEEVSEKIYQEIGAFLEELSQKKMAAHLIFSVKILKILGIAPLVSAQKYLDPETGVFLEHPVHQLFSEEVSELWKIILSEEQPYRIMLPRGQRKPLLDSIMLYCRCHIPEFRVPKSLEILQEIFS